MSPKHCRQDSCDIGPVALFHHGDFSSAQLDHAEGRIRKNVVYPILDVPLEHYGC